MKSINDYRHFAFEDLIEDRAFRAWVFSPTPKQDRFWKQFQTAYPEKEELLEEARTFLLGAKDYFEEISQSDQVIQSKLQQLLHRSGTAVPKVSHPNKNRRFFQLWAIAASIAVVLGLLSWIWLRETGSRMQVVATHYGEWKTVELPDGSEVQLNANSEIKFNGQWETGKHREVWLSGEAFFIVTKDEEGAKFTVYTNDLAVEVLGTSFNVLSRSDQTEVFLEEGKVRLEMGLEEKILESGDFIAYSSKQKEITDFRKTSTERHASWKDGSLILVDRPVSEIMAKIEEIFGYEVVVQNRELLKEQRTVGIPMDVIEVAIPILEISLNVNIEIEEDRLLIR